MKRREFLQWSACAMAACVGSQAAPQDKGRIRLIVKADDYGWAHYVNAGVERCLTEGIVTCAALMTIATETLPAEAAPGSPEWTMGGGDGFPEALKFCQAHPQYQFGVHLSFDHYRPCSPPSAVPSLLDSNGRLPGYGMLDGNATAIGEFRRKQPRLDEVEKEERCQIDRLRQAGVPPVYLDDHNGVTRIPELRGIQEKLSRDYRVCVAHSHGEKPLPFGIDAAPLTEKTSGLLDALEKLTPGLWLMTTHPMWPTDPRMRNIGWWANPKAKESMAEHAQACVEAITSPKVKQLIRNRGIELIGYRELRDEVFGKA